MKKFKRAGIDKIRTLFFLLRGTQLNAKLQTPGSSLFHQPSLKILNFAENYLPLTKNKIFTNHTSDKRSNGHPIDDSEDRE